MRFAALAFVIATLFSAPPAPITVYMVGDSTMADKPDAAHNPERGWGQALPSFFDGSVTVRNHAVNGRSSKSFIDEGRWEAVRTALHAGDFVLIQFAHNDEKVEDTTRYAAPESSYRANLERFVRDTRAAGAVPVLFTPIVRRQWNEHGELTNTHGKYPTVVREVARQHNVLFVDLEQLTAELLQSYGPDKSKLLFVWTSEGQFASFPAARSDNTHLSPEGARLVAQLAVRRIHAFRDAQGRTLGAHALIDPRNTDTIPALWSTLTPGANHVGYRRLDTSAGIVHVWYPSIGSSRALSLREYLGADTIRFKAFLSGAGARNTAARMLDSRMFATAAAQPVSSSFPLILVAQGNGQDVFDQVVLCEYLASNGFVVATTPSPMLRSPMQREDQIGEFAMQQSADLSAAIGAVASSVHARVNTIGVVGHSFGARAALLLAMNDSRIKAVVSLDGGIGTATGRESFTHAKTFNGVTQLPPLLHFYEKLDVFMKPEFTLLRSVRLKSFQPQQVRAMHHTHFTTYGFAVGLFPELAALTHATKETAPEAVNVAQQSLQFLQSYLNAN